MGDVLSFIEMSGGTSMWVRAKVVEILNPESDQFKECGNLEHRIFQDISVTSTYNFSNLFLKS